MKIYKFIGFIALLGWSAVSCNDWLDVRPDTEQKEEDQFSTYKGFRDALTGCYMALANEDVYGCRLTMSCTEALAGLWHMPDEPSSTSDRYQDYHLMLHEYDNDGARQAVQAIYSKLYNIIVQANLVIKHAEDNAAAFPDEASPIPVLPEVGSIIVAPGFNLPFLSASSIMASATRSFTEPAGLKYSSLAMIAASSTPASFI